MNRITIIDRLITMFNKVNNNHLTPDWLISLYSYSNNDTLIQNMNNWRRNYPDLYNKYGVFVM